MANDILRTLLVASMLAGLVILLLCAIRTPLRRIFGARVAYLAWFAVPATMLAMAAAELSTMRMPAPVLQVVTPLRHLASAGLSDAGMAGTPWEQWQTWLVAAWLAIAAAMLAWYGEAHRRYRQRLGLLCRDGGIHYSIRTDQGPAVVGLWRPIVVVPADFATRYTPQEQQLILAHEAVHVRRRDPLMNALCALMQCALWFHPLVHLAARRFRLDQELACDAAVMHAHPALQRSYADAMLKTQLSAQAVLIHCHWQSTHPLKERIIQLQQTPPTKLRRAFGRVTIAALVAACGYGAMAANAAGRCASGGGQRRVAHGAAADQGQWQLPGSSCSWPSASRVIDGDDVNRQAAQRGFLVLGLHVSAGLAHGFDHFVEADKVRAVAF
jgi:beta-lactamase regulating signal transducer with metallopeptidase domain